MNLALVARLLAGFTLFFTGLAVVPLVVAVFEGPGDQDTIAGFAWAIASGAAIALVLRIFGRKAPPEFFRREGLAVVGLAWVIAGIVGAIPLFASGSLHSFVDACFESVSGLTTTGATVYNSAGNPAPEALARSLLLWRSLLQWVGGTGVILVFTVLLPALGMTGKNLLDSEAVGVVRQDQRPRVREQARNLFRLYVLLTVLTGAGYWLAGMGAFDALNHAFTTTSTGGFSTRNYSIGQYDDLGIELCSIVFMFLGGASFPLMLSALRGRDLRTLRANPEFRTYALLTAGAVLFTTLVLWGWGRQVEDPAVGVVKDYSDFGTCLRDAGLQVVSILTSTGYASANFQVWPTVALFVLLICMLIGGSTNSTAGGFKVYRVLVCAKLVGFALRRFIRPRTVEKLKLGDELLPNGLISTILTLLILWFGGVAVGTLVLGLDPRLDALSAFSASASMLGCTGPAITAVLPTPDGGFALANPGGIDLGPYGGYGALAGYAKVWLSLQMILGRLEILAPLVLFVPAFWRK